MSRRQRIQRRWRWRWRSTLAVAAVALAMAPYEARGSSVGSASSDDGAWAMDDADVACADEGCLRMHRTTLACVPAERTSSLKQETTCGKCLPGFIEGCGSEDGAGDAPQLPCIAAAPSNGANGVDALRGGGSHEYEEDDSDDHHGGFGMPGTLGTAMGSVVVGLMCLVTWRGWMDCCSSRSKRREKNRATMTAMTDQWRCSNCLHENSNLRGYCVLCRTEMQHQQLQLEDCDTVTISVDTVASSATDGYVAMGTPRGRAALVSSRLTCSTDGQLIAAERLEWKRSVAKDGTLRWKRYHAADVRRRARLQGTFVREEDPCVRAEKVAAASVAGFFVTMANQAVTMWVPVDGAAARQEYKQWRKLTVIASLSFDQRLRWLYQELLKLRHQSDDKYTIRVNRDRIVKQTALLFQTAPPSTLRRQFRVDFMNEPGVDGGGILREWLHLICKELFSESAGFFKKVESSLDTGYWIRHTDSSVKRTRCELQMFKFFGMLLAKALLEGLVLNVRLSIPLLKHLLGAPLSREDLRFLDEQVYASTTFLLQNTCVDQLSLTFNIAGQDLILHGSEVPVTDSNKHGYVDRMVQYYLLDSVESELSYIMQGFRGILPDKLLHIFDFKELDLVLSGLSEIDVVDWRAHTNVGKLGHDSQQEQRVIDWFWEIVEAMDQHHRSRLLQYVTGSSGVPVEGFAALTSTDGRLQPFTIQLMPDVSKPYTILPYASTCFNRLDLPLFKEKRDLEHVMEMVVNIDVTGFNRR